MCAFFFSFVVVFWTDEHFGAYFVASTISTDMIYDAETKFLRFYIFSVSKQQSKEPLNMDRLDFCMNMKTVW